MGVDQSMKNLYRQKLSRNTRSTGRLLALFGAPYIAIITACDFFTHQNQDVFYFRLSVFLTLTAFFLVTQLRPQLSHKEITRLHFISLAAIIFMTCSLIVNAPEDCSAAFLTASATNRLITLALILYFFAAGVRPYLQYLLVIPTIFLITYAGIFYKLDGVALAYLVKAVMIVLAILIYNHWEIRERTREFVSIRLAEYQKIKLENELNKHKQRVQKLESQANHDELTNLFNRRVAFAILEKHLATAHEYQTPLTVCFIDVDQLKQVNDTKGHAAGDHLLCRVARSLRENVRCSDYICRLGGDEFLIILPDCPLKTAQAIVKIIRQDLNANHQIDFSYGFAAYPQDTMADVQVFVDTADRNMYLNKISKRKMRDRDLHSRGKNFPVTGNPV
jgi:diguanylate cyclase (GGDEF)-like protein